MPKGVMWRQDDLFARLIDGGVRHYAVDGGLEAVRAVARGQPGRRHPPAGLPAHARDRRLHRPTRCWPRAGGSACSSRASTTRSSCSTPSSARRSTASSSWATPSRRPLLAALDEHPGKWDLSSLMMIISSGAMWSEPVKEALLAHHPGMLLVDAFSSSEALGMGVSVSAGGAAAKTASFTLGPDVKVLTEDGRPGGARVRRGRRAGAGRAQPARLLQGRGEVGAAPSRRSTGCATPSRATSPRSTPTAPSTCSGRGSVCINSGGEKIFPEEVEEALKTHAAVRDAVVVGIPHPTYGEQIVAVVELRRRRRRAGRGRADRAREGAAWPRTRRPGGCGSSPPSGGRPTARSTTSATGPSRWRSSGSPPAELG